ncbi:hypothetical protein H2201_007330 [Coniosporium apollinis]|uniref:Uncharacterized protein n=2 Tax=Coniosporium TaxID=2810619 RepID=A0ABQ9NJD0_9PEZI|nr:hypothetical protein H2199_006125 [Cladosporium sp. JES 115]KAJ9659581.1 hypothetical protein H2201_007330 [Coniosporium apollinis]
MKENQDFVPPATVFDLSPIMNDPEHLKGAGGGAGSRPLLTEETNEAASPPLDNLPGGLKLGDIIPRLVESLDKQRKDMTTLHEQWCKTLVVALHTTEEECHRLAKDVEPMAAALGGIRAAQVKAALKNNKFEARLADAEREIARLSEGAGSHYGT